MGGEAGMRLIVAWLFTCLGLFVAAAVVPEISYRDDWGTLPLAGAILGLVNFALRPLVILVTLPAVVISLGIALLCVNALMLWLTSEIV
jgi:putative membrane protein